MNPTSVLKEFAAKEPVALMVKPLFGVLKRGVQVYVEIVKNCSKSQLMPII